MHSNNFFLFMNTFLLDIQYYYFLINKEIANAIILAMKSKLYSFTPHLFFFFCHLRISYLFLSPLFSLVNLDFIYEY